MRCLGVDGCKAGWVVIERARADARPAIEIVERVETLFDRTGRRVVAIDIPIGLTERGARICDMMVRGALAARASSVFPAPVRAVLAATSYEDACRRSMKAHGKKISKQTWAIVPKMRDGDGRLLRRPELRDEAWEVHPEMSFTAWNGEPMTHSKKTKLGMVERLGLVEEHFGVGTFERLRDAVPRKQAADDDLVDALAALWSAERIARGKAEWFPDPTEADPEGLEMRISC